MIIFMDYAYNNKSVPRFRNSSDFGIIWEAISGNYLGELEPQFASKDSYFEQNIKQVCRNSLGVIKHTWTSHLISIIIHVPYEKILDHLG